MYCEMHLSNTITIMSCEMHPSNTICSWCSLGSIDRDEGHPPPELGLTQDYVWLLANAIQCHMATEDPGEGFQPGTRTLEVSTVILSIYLRKFINFKCSHCSKHVNCISKIPES